MATVTSTPSDLSIQLRNKFTSGSGTIEWTAPSIPSGATITSCMLTGTITPGGSITGVTINDESIATTSGSFSVSLGTTITSSADVTVTRTAPSKNTTINVKFTDMTYIVTYTEPATYTVTFKDWDGTVLKTQTVEEGSSATAPDNPTRDGYVFTGWDIDFSNVTSNLTVTAQYAETQYFTVTFKDWNGTVLGIQTVEIGKSATAPSNPTREGYTFIGWDTDFSNVTRDLTVTAQYEETVVYDIKVVKYKFDNTLDVIPAFNTGFTYTYEDIVEGNITTRTIYSNSLPTSMDMGTNSYKLTYVEYIDISNLTSLRYMFNDCLNLTNINNINNWNTTNIVSMQNTFSNCTSLTTLDIKNWNVDNITNMREMFYWMTGITELDLSNWNTSNVTTMSYMFYGCKNLATINLGTFNMNKVTDTSGMFLNCTNLTSIIMNNSDYNSVNKIIEKIPTRTSDSPGTLNIEGVDDFSQVDITTAQSKFWNVVEETEINNLVARYTANAAGVVPTFNSGYAYELTETENNGIYTVEIISEEDFSTFSFKNKTNLLGIEYLNVTSAVTSLDSSFLGCTNLKYVNGIDEWDISNSSLTRMYCLFSDCPKLETIDFSLLTNHNINMMMSAFRRCSNLTSVNLDGFINSSINISYLFQDCYSLETITMNSCDLSNATVSASFSLGTSSLKNIEMKNTNYTSVNKVISDLHTRTSEDPGTLNIEGVDDSSQVDVTTAQSKFWNIVGVSIEPEEPDNNELIQGDINDSTGAFEDEVPNVVKTKYIDISGKKQITVNVLTENVYVLKCYLYNANKELVKIIDISEEKKRMFGIDIQKLIDEVMNDGNE